MFKKVPFFLGVIMLSLAAVTFSCNKHDDDDDDWGGGNGGGINIVDNTIIGTWGVERIENIIISNNGETI